MNGTYTTECEYCGESFSRLYLADKDKADHKRKCDKKRFLGGDLVVEVVPQNEAMKKGGNK